MKGKPKVYLSKAAYAAARRRYVWAGVRAEMERDLEGVARRAEERRKRVLRGYLAPDKVKGDAG